MNGYIVISANIVFAALMWFAADTFIAFITTCFCATMVCAIYKYNCFIVDMVTELKDEIRRLGGVI